MTAKINILNLINFEEVNNLLEGFNQSTGFVTAILDLEGNVLSQSGWRQICTQFHRVNSATSKNCTVSDTVLANELGKGEKYHFYKCLNGLVDVAVPIIIKGEHVANLFSGQFFFEKPNRTFFEKQAKKYGFNKTEYLLALDNVPVVSKEKVKIAMDFLLNMTQLISEMTYQKLEQVQLNEALTKSEERFRDIIFSSADWVWEVDKDGKYTYSSQKSIDFFKVSEGEIIGKTPFDLMPEDEAKRVAAIFAEIVAKKEPIKDLENWNIGKNGELICLLTNGLPILNNEGELVGYRGIDKDITERKLFEQELIKAKERAEESDRLKSAFLANMSHEIRTPMNGILGFARLLKEPELTGEQQQEYIRVIEKSGARMLNMIHDIVSISKIESGITDVHPSETNINHQLQFVYDSLKLDAQSKNLNLLFNCELADKDSFIITDIEKLYGILTNLVKNAIKYTDTGAIEFGYTVKGEIIEFYIIDTGIGIAKERLDAIFERFIQADITDKMARQGAGLGLSIAKAYVTMLGGKIWVESKENVGSKFYFTIPRINGKVKEIVNSDSIKAEENKIKNLKILIADDDDASNQLLSIYVKDFAKEIITVITGREAIEKCKMNNDIDVVLMDIQMPDINGYEATRKIRKFNKNVIIIAQTAFALTGDKEKSIAAGCNDYISKPIQKGDLEIIIQKNLRN